MHHLKQAARALAHRRAYFFTCALTLALVLGANAAMFAVLSATLLRPLPFTAGDRVVKLFMLPPGMTAPHQRNPIQQMDLGRIRERTRTMRRIEGFLRAERVITTNGEPGVVQAAYVTAGLMEMMGVTPAQGRLLRPGEDAPGHPVALVTDGYRRRVLGGEALGQTVVLDGVAHTIVGVTPAGYPPGFLEADIFTPLVANPEPLGRNPSRSIVAVAELADGVSVADADREMKQLAEGLAAEFPRLIAGWSGGAQPMRDWQYGSVKAPVLLLFGAAAVVLLIACANIASLTSAHAAARAADLSLRVALGATRLDLLRLQAAELALVALTGAALGLVLAAAAIPALLALDPVAARTLGPVAIDWRVQLFTTAIAMLTAVGASILPARQAFRRFGAAGTAGSARRAVGSPAARRLRRGLVAGQVMLCVTLLMTGAVLLNGLRAAARTDPGFTAAGILTAQVRLSPAVYDTTERRAAVVERILERVRALPGVEAASTTMNDFIPGNAYQTMFHVPGRPTPDGQPHATQFRRVSPDYFRVMKIRELRGRTFTAQDGPGSPSVAVVSRMLAEQLFPGKDAVGRTLQRTAANAPPTTIIGVVGDVYDVSLTQAPEPTLYLAWAQNSANAVPVSLVIRTDVEPDSLTHAVREAVLAIDPAMPLRRVQTLETFLEDGVAPERFRTLLLAILAGLGLTLAALGIYGVTYRAVTDRSHEFAVRLALGGRPPQLLAMVLGDSLRDVGAGAIAGAIAGTWLCAVIAQAVTNVDRGGAGAAAIAIAVVGAAALVAIAIPALRVLRLHPAHALRA